MSDERVWEEDESKPDPRSWGDGYRAGYEQALQDAAAKLVDVADWCRSHGFDARARHTTSAAQRVLLTGRDTPSSGEPGRGGT